MKIENHWIDQATKIASENFDERPTAMDISLIVIHCISLPPEQFGGHFVDQLFCNQLNADAHPYFKEIAHVKVSAHLFINRDGHLSQYVAFDKRAWHAGVSQYRGRQKCNDFSIGIELEGSEKRPYTDHQYKQLAIVIKTLLSQYPGLSSQDIVGHSDIAPGRKTDPGQSFDWNRLYTDL